MSESSAWLLNLGEDVLVAVGKHELRYLLADPPAFATIPKTPAHCCKVFVWQGSILPVMDLAQYILGRPVLRTASEDLVVLATFQADKDAAALEHGAMLLRAIPLDIKVDDSQACDLPEPSHLWRGLAKSCFLYGKHVPIPVLDLPKLFRTMLDYQTVCN